MLDIRKLFGPRIIKTGISTLLTAAICMLLNLPPIFAVITAIVTIEPTANASLKKAYIRFPASIIGAFIAVTSLYFFGENAFTYAVSATLTIFVTYRLKLHDGILVAAITAVAMIPSVQDAYLYHFLSRLATTTIGLTTSTLINYFILPPNFTPRIKEIITESKTATGKLLKKRFKELSEDHFASTKSEQRHGNIQKQLVETEQLIQFQQDEYRYHRFKREEVRYLHQLAEEVQHIKLLFTHIGNLIYLTEDVPFELTDDEKRTLLRLSETLPVDTEEIEEIIHPLRESINELQDEEDTYKIHLLYEVIVTLQMNIQVDGR